MELCPKHQVPVGPRGCPRCLREVVLARETESGHFWRWAALVFGSILAAMVLTIALWPSSRKAETRLDPAAFRPAIEAVEAALYHAGRLEAAKKVSLQQGLADLQARLRRLRPSVAQRRAMEQYPMFCTMAAVEVEHEGFDVVATRKRWEALRAAHFHPAPWFRASSPALELAQATESAGRIPADTHLYQPAIDELRLLVSRAEAASRPREDLGGDPPPFSTTRAEIKADLERIRSGLPATVAGMDPAWRKAHADLEAAMTAAGYMGSLGARTRAATAAVDRAQASLNAALATAR
jgi:hypothetical protein